MQCLSQKNVEGAGIIFQSKLKVKHLTHQHLGTMLFVHLTVDQKLPLAKPQRRKGISIFFRLGVLALEFNNFAKIPAM